MRINLGGGVLAVILLITNVCVFFLSVITSAKEVNVLPVCFVPLLAISGKKLLIEYSWKFYQKCIYEQGRTGWFWKSAFGAGSRDVLNDSSVLRDLASFHNAALISGKTDQIFVKNFIGIRSPDPESGPGSTWRRSTQSRCSILL